MSAPVIALCDVRKTYRFDGGEFEALKGVSFEVGEGEMVALMGPSGSGKSTLMNVLGLLDSLSSGTYLLRGQDVATLSERERAAARNAHIGFVFQAFNLLPRMSLLENVEMPMLYAGVPPKRRRERARELLELVGLGAKAGNGPNQVSGGQKQRAAIARALALAPALLLADEPTGNLDTRTGEEIMDLFRALNAAGSTVLIVTHELDIAAQTRRVVVLRDGVIESDGAPAAVAHGPAPLAAGVAP